MSMSLNYTFYLVSKAAKSILYLVRLSKLQAKTYGKYAILLILSLKMISAKIIIASKQHLTHSSINKEAITFQCMILLD